MPVLGESLDHEVITRVLRGPLCDSCRRTGAAVGEAPEQPTPGSGGSGSNGLVFGFSAGVRRSNTLSFWEVDR